MKFSSCRIDVIHYNVTRGIGTLTASLVAPIDYLSIPVLGQAGFGVRWAIRARCSTELWAT